MTGILVAAALLAIAGVWGCGRAGDGVAFRATAGRKVRMSAAVEGDDDESGQWLRAAQAMRQLGGLPQAGDTPTASTISEPDQVGVLFAGSKQVCTASVVDSPRRDLLITAAHCIKGGRETFVPAYQDGERPYGTWTAARTFTDRRWTDDSDPDLDVGFIALRPRGGRNIQDVVGGDRLAVDAGYTNLVRVSGYAYGSTQAVTCVNWTSRQAVYQVRFVCGGYPGGTSGSPWVTGYDPATGTGAVVGVIGGYQAGGDTASVSYSAYLDQHIWSLYVRAVRG